MTENKAIKDFGYGNQQKMTITKYESDLKDKIVLNHDFKPRIMTASNNSHRKCSLEPKLYNQQNMDLTGDGVL